MDSRPDAELTATVLAGDIEAFAPLVRRYRDRSARFAVRILGRRDAAEDVLPSVFLRAFRTLGTCNEPARFHAWLYQIVVNECRSFATRTGRREQRLVRDEAALASLPTPRVADEPGWPDSRE